jgi:parvulin-like peptidyl-prolyl isomerase
MESFAEAARQHSTSPSARQGGDLGYFRFQGRMPAAIAAVAFALPVGEISQPFRSSFGAHLVTVTDRKPGDLSLEDVRADVLEAVSRALWDDQVRQERAGAAIEWKVERRSGS